MTRQPQPQPQPLDLDAIERRLAATGPAVRADIPEAIADIESLLAEVRRLTAELAPYDALQLGHPDGRISTTCTAGKHPTWLRYPEDTRYYACPWCESYRLTAELQQARQQTADTRAAWKCLKTGLIASADLLDKPFSNAPDQSPWTRLKPSMRALEAATDPAAVSGA